MPAFTEGDSLNLDIRNDLARGMGPEGKKFTANIRPE
jgi:hypothetical protein